MPAATAARFPRANPASARSASTAAEGFTFPTDTSRSAMRSNREEAILSCLPRRAGLQFWHAGLRSALRVLPELGDFAGVARSERGSPPLPPIPEMLVPDALRQGARVLVSTYNEPLITSEWAVAVFQGTRKPRACSPPLFRMATERRRCWSICIPGSISTRSI